MSLLPQQAVLMMLLAQSILHSFLSLPWYFKSVLALVYFSGSEIYFTNFGKFLTKSSGIKLQH